MAAARAALLLLVVGRGVGVWAWDEACVDGFGRPGRVASCIRCPTRFCSASCKYCAALQQQPQRVADGEWRCIDDTYRLTGAKFSWPGGRVLIEPETCTPIEFLHNPPALFFPEDDLIVGTLTLPTFPGPAPADL